MDYRLRAIDDLRRKKSLETAEMNCKERIRAIQAKLKTTPATRTDAITGSGDNYAEARLNALIDAKYDEIHRLKSTLNELRPIQRAWDSLTGEEQKILTVFFIDKYSSYTERCEAIGYEKSQAYRLRDAALVNFTRALCGSVIT